jgi:hypothetical protein
MNYRACSGILSDLKGKWIKFTVHFNSWPPIPRTEHLRNCFKSRFCLAGLDESHSRQASEYGKTAVQKLCSALDETFITLERLTDRTESEKTNLQSIALPSNENSLAYVQVVLRHNFSPSKVADLVNSLKSMQSEIRACIEKLESSFRHVHDLYNISNNRLERVATSTSNVSTSTMLTARIKLAGWLKRREGIWRLSSRSTSIKVRLYQRNSVSLS